MRLITKSERKTNQDGILVPVHQYAVFFCAHRCQFKENSMATAAETVTAIDAAIYDLVTNGFEEVQFNGRRYRYADLDKLQKARSYYAGLAAKAGGKTGFKLNGFKAASSRGTTISD